MLEQILNIHKVCFPEMHWTISDLQDLKKSGCEFISSENGFIIWRSVLDEAEIISIGVNPVARRTGIATAMLTLVENDLKKHNIKHIFLDVSDKNLSAINLYHKCGFVDFSTRSAYYNDGTNAIMMKKEL